MQQPTIDPATDAVTPQPHEIEAAVTMHRNVVRARRRRGTRMRSTMAAADVSTGQADARQITTAMAVVQ